MRKQTVIFIVFMLVFAAAGSSALAKKASSARAQQAATVREEKQVGPKPLPSWYWRWINWRLGEGYARGHGLEARLRPSSAPARIESWTWRRFHLFLRARALGGGGRGPLTSGGKAYEHAIAYTHKRPAFSPTRKVSVSNASQLQAAISNLRPGDLVQATRSFTVNGTTLIMNRLSAPAELDLGGVHFVYSGGQNEPAVAVTNARNLYIYGGDLTTSNTGGTCLNDHGSQHVLWWGFHIHDCGGSGFAALTAPDAGPVNDDDFQGSITHIGQNLAWDPHSEKGTGEHGAILWDANTDNAFTNNRFAFYTYGIPTGACVELGNDQSASQAAGNILYEKCVNATEMATRQTGGNGLQLWGDTNSLGLDVKYLEVDNAEGQALNSQGLTPGKKLTGVTVEYGRAAKTNLSPRFAGQSPWDSSGGVVYKRVRPAR